MDVQGDLTLLFHLFLSLGKLLASIHCRSSRFLTATLFFLCSHHLLSLDFSFFHLLFLCLSFCSLLFSFFLSDFLLFLLACFSLSLFSSDSSLFLSSLHWLMYSFSCSLSSFLCIPAFLLAKASSPFIEV